MKDNFKSGFRYVLNHSRFLLNIKPFISIIIFLFSFPLFAQPSITLSGFVLDSASGEKLTGASVYDSITGHNSIANANGYFSLRTNPASQMLMISYVGHSTQKRWLNFTTDAFLNFELPGFNYLKEVTITSGKPMAVYSLETPGQKSIPMEMIRNLPAILGESDVMKTAQMLPGVQPGSEANTGLFVRGGEGDQNLLLLDGVEVFNPDHLFGFFSVFNDDAFKSVKMYLSGFPAKYNGRLSSVLDIRTRDGDSRHFHVNASIGDISSKLQVQGPLIKDKLTCIVSYRRTYLGILAKPIIRHFTDYSDADYFFQDLNSRLRWNVNSKNTVSISHYFGADHGYFKKNIREGIDPPDSSGSYANSGNRMNFDWGNNLLVARWESAVSNRTFLNFSLSMSRYNFNGKDENTDLLKYWYFDSLMQLVNRYSLNTRSVVTSYSALVDLDYLLSYSQKISYGGGYRQYHLNPAVERLNSEGASSATYGKGENSEKFTAVNYFLYLQDEITLFNKLNITPGLHYTLYRCNGSAENKLLKRLELNYTISRNLAIHASYSEMEQYLQLLSLSRISLASDLWLPAFGRLKPAASRDLSAGISYSKGAYNAGIDVYSRKFNNLISYREGVSFLQHAGSFLDLITSGSGKSAGIESYFEKTMGKLSGMVSYTYSRSMREFPEINFGEEFPARYDRPHVFKTNLSYSLNTRWTVSAIWIFMSGSLQTIPLKNYISWFNYMPSYSTNGGETTDILLYQKYDYRLPAYHRMDIEISYMKSYKHFSGTLSLGAYNAYNSQNPYDVQIKFTPVVINQNMHSYYYQIRELDKKVLFPIFPFISYRVEI